MEWVYPKTIEEYIAMEEQRKQNKAKMYAEIYCENCRSYTGERYSSYLSIPDKTVCPKCNQKITECYSKAVVIYKMI